MNSNIIENNLSLLPWVNTRTALSSLQELLKCNVCHEIPNSPQYMGRCDHFFCNSCIMKMSDTFCPICKIPSPPCERNPDIIVRNLISSTKEMFALINGHKIPNETVGHEAPELPLHSIQSSNSKINRLNTPSSLDKENAMKGNVFKVKSSLLKNESLIPSNLKKNKPTTKTNHSSGSKTSTKKLQTNIRQSNNNKTAEFIEKSFTATNNHSNLENQQLPYVPVIKDTNPPLETTSTSSTKPQNTSILGVSPVSFSIDKRNLKGETLLHTACIKGNVTKVKELLSDGANPNTRDNAGWTPLHEACSHGYEDIVNLLVENGALVDVPGNNNMTPLHDAVLTETLPVIRLLRRWGACDTTRDIWGRSARSLADCTKVPLQVHAALNTPRDETFVPKHSPGPLINRIVILEPNYNSAFKKKMEKVAKLLKVKVVNEFSADVTHVVVRCEEKERVCHRTLKYMMGVVAGKWIVSHHWVDACLSQGGPANPADYEVEGTVSNPRCFAPSKGRLNASQMLPGLFIGCHVYFCGNFGNGLPTKKELEALIRAGEGIALQREPNPESIEEYEQTVPFHASADGHLAKCSHLCIYADGPNEPKLKYDMAHIKSLPLSWLYDCIDSWSLYSFFGSLRASCLRFLLRPTSKGLCMPSRHK